MTVLDRQDTVATPATVIPFLRTLRCPKNRLLWFSGETGTSLRHVGPLVGQGAHASLWPRIMAWVGDPERREETPSPSRTKRDRVAESDRRIGAKELTRRA
ncbi:MAG: hypothetical protein HY900_21715 [Deltaproteobacteria bacterium]|nr:hypothetical protein [Deltaproteobacteria bacterium]